MSPHPRVQETAQSILDAFAAGQVPKALANVFLTSSGDFPAAQWSLRNRFLLALSGHTDARGYRQWLAVRRQVKKGQRACYILTPRLVRHRDEQQPGLPLAPKDEPAAMLEPKLILVGFLAVPVFGYSQTEGDPLPGAEQETAFIEQLPLVQVARSWNLAVTLLDGRISGYAGSYVRGKRIELAVENLSTWAHELVHAADHRLGTLNVRGGQQLDNEVVAELGGAVLLECLGQTVASDRGGAWEYINAYASKHQVNPLAVCLELFERTSRCVSLILDTAAQLGAALPSQEPTSASEPWDCSNELERAAP